MDVLDETATREALRQLPGWELTGDGVAKTFIFDSFRSAMLFVERIGDSTEGTSQAAGHHPQIDIRSDQVRIAIPRSDATGVTRADIALARHVERLGGEHTHTRRDWLVLPETRWRLDVPTGYRPPEPGTDARRSWV